MAFFVREIDGFQVNAHRNTALLDSLQDLKRRQQPASIRPNPAREVGMAEGPAAPWLAR